MEKKDKSSQACPQEELLMYLENALGKEEELRVRTHVSECTKCQETLAFIRKVSHIISRTPLEHKHIGPCPADSLLSKYHSGKVDAETSARLGYHVSHCAACTEKFLSLERAKSEWVKKLFPALGISGWASLSDFEDRLGELVTRIKESLEELVPRQIPRVGPIELRGTPQVKALVVSREGEISEEALIDIKDGPAIDEEGRLRLTIEFPVIYSGKETIIGLKVADELVTVYEGETVASGSMYLSGVTVGELQSQQLSLPQSLVSIIIIN